MTRLIDVDSPTPAGPAMTGLLASLDRPPSGRRRPVWFDNLTYCREKLLAGRPVPWCSPAELAAFYGRAQDMFGSDAVLVDLADLYGQRAAEDRLRQAMGARRRPGYPLRVLLGDERTRSCAEGAVGRLTAGTVAVPTLLTLPSPARWLSVAARQAGQDDEPPDRDQAETAAFSVADLLQIFADTGLDGLLLDEGPTGVADLMDPRVYQAVLDVAAGSGWPVFVRTDAAPAWPHGPVPGVAGWLGSGPPQRAGLRWGLVTAEERWAAADCDLVLAATPADGDPDTIMRSVRERP